MSQHRLGSHPLKSSLKLVHEGSPFIFYDEDHLPNKTDAIVHATPPPDGHSIELTGVRSSDSPRQDNRQKKGASTLQAEAPSEATHGPVGGREGHGLRHRAGEAAMASSQPSGPAILGLSQGKHFA